MAICDPPRATAMRRAATESRASCLRLLAMMATFAGHARTAEFPLAVTAGGDLVVETRCAGRTCLALVDSGATHCVIDRAFCRATGIRTRRVRGSTRTVDAVTEGVELVDGAPAIEGPGAGWESFTVIDLGLANHGSPRPVVLILGLDWLRARGAVIDLPAMTLRTRD